MILQRKVKMSDNIHILVVDDNQINRQYFFMALNKFGYQVTLAENGFEAIDYANDTTFDIIFMDIRMPEMDGNQAASKIRKINKHKNTPILAISAESNTNKNSDLFNGFILKPVSPKQLKHNIEKFCKKEKPILKVYDQEKALKYTYNDKEILDKLIGMFLKDIPLQITLLKQSINQKDYNECHQIIHKLRGSSTTFGAMELDDELKNLSKMLINDESQIKQSVIKLESAVTQFINTVK